MRILSIGRPKFLAEKTLAGVYLLRQVNSYLALYALSRDVTKSRIMRDMIEDWHKDKEETDPVDYLIEKIVNKIKHLWDVRTSIREESFDKFKEDLEKDLKRIGIDEEHISAILANVKNGKDEKTTSK